MPYLICDHELMGALKLAAKRGGTVFCFGADNGEEGETEAVAEASRGGTENICFIAVNKIADVLRAKGEVS